MEALSEPLRFEFRWQASGELVIHWSVTVFFCVRKMAPLVVGDGFSRSGELVDEWPLFGVVNVRWRHWWWVMVSLGVVYYWTSGHCLV